jgi:hypothetical protein
LVAIIEIGPNGVTRASADAEHDVAVIGQDAGDAAAEHAGRSGQENGIRCSHAT